MVIDSKMTTSGKADSSSMVKLQKGDKIIQRRRIDWETNQSHFKMRGYSLVEDKTKKKKSKK